ncbi:MAG TPA: NAD(P)-dependent oxidoreductase [Terriglobales bacterium]
MPLNRLIGLLGDLSGTAAAICLGTAMAGVYALFATPAGIEFGMAIRGLRQVFVQEEAVVPLLLVLLLLASGAYRPTSFYRKHKMATVLHSVTWAYLLYVVAVYLIVRRPPEARAELVFSYLLTALILIGLRQAKLIVVRAETRPGPLVGGDGKHVLVIGGAGYIGSQLCENLLRDGYRVRILDNLTYGDRAIQPLLNHPKLELLRADMRHLESLALAVRTVDSVVHLGAIVGDPACALDNETTVEINLLATRMVRDLCQGNGLRRLIFASTCSVYGAGAGVTNESSELHPVSLYACTKIDSEKCLLEAEGPCSQVIFRLATVFGLSPRPRFDLVVNLLSAQANFRQKFTIFNPGQWRPLVHVADVCHALQLGLEAEDRAVRNEIFNLGDDTMNFTLGQIGEAVCRHFPEAHMECVEKTADHRDYRVNFGKIRRVLGFQRQHDLESGIQELQDAFSSGRIPNYQDPFFYNLDYLRNEPAKRLNILRHDGTSRDFITRAAQAGR